MKQNYFLIILFFLNLFCIFKPMDENEAKKKFYQIKIKFHEYNFLERNITYVETGNLNSSILILFIHGSPGSWDVYKEYLLDSDLQNYHLISVNRLGYSIKGKNVFEPSLEKQAKVFLPILEKELKKKIFVLGHSYGGPVAIELNYFYPKISGLVLLAPSIDPSLEEVTWYQKFANLISFILPSAIDVCNKEILALKNELIKQENHYQNLTNKITYIHGTKDNLVPFQNYSYIEKKINLKENLKLIQIENGNHFIVWNKFQLIKSEILKLVSEN